MKRQQRRWNDAFGLVVPESAHALYLSYIRAGHWLNPPSIVTRTPRFASHMSR